MRIQISNLLIYHWIQPIIFNGWWLKNVLRKFILKYVDGSVKEPDIDDLKGEEWEANNVMVFFFFFTPRNPLTPLSVDEKIYMN